MRNGFSLIMSSVFMIVFAQSAPIFINSISVGESAAGIAGLMALGPAVAGMVQTLGTIAGSIGLIGGMFRVASGGGFGGVWSDRDYEPVLAVNAVPQAKAAAPQVMIPVNQEISTDDLPSEATLHIAAILRSVDAYGSRVGAKISMNDDSFTMSQMRPEYIPSTLTKYRDIPEIARSRYDQTLIEQLALLDTVASRVLEGKTTEAATLLKVNGAFLKERFADQ